MKKNTINAFTLVEMLIVIVIIGILIAALLPRMQAAQWRARDVSRKTALSQIQSAIVVSQWDKWAWPGMPKNKSEELTKEAWEWIDVQDIKDQLEAAWLNWIPEDPLKSQLIWLWADQDEDGKGQYRYMVLPRNGTAAWWFILMAKTEVEWWSNWVYCGSEGDIKKWNITAQTSASEKGNATDLKTIIPCGSLVQDEEKCGRVGDVDEEEMSEDDVCYYNNDGQLRYIITY